MNAQDLMQLCEQYPGATSDYPFGEQPKCYRVGNKIFAMVYEWGIPGALRIMSGDESMAHETVLPMVTLRGEPTNWDFFKQQYPKAVFRPYHCSRPQRPYAVTVLLNGAVPDDILTMMLGHAYTTIFNKLPKYVRESIQAWHLDEE